MASHAAIIFFLPAGSIFTQSSYRAIRGTRGAYCRRTSHTYILYIRNKIYKFEIIKCRLVTAEIRCRRQNSGGVVLLPQYCLPNNRRRRIVSPCRSRVCIILCRRIVILLYTLHDPPTHRQQWLETIWLYRERVRIYIYIDIIYICVWVPDNAVWHCPR